MLPFRKNLGVKSLHGQFLAAVIPILMAVTVLVFAGSSLLEFSEARKVLIKQIETAAKLNAEGIVAPLWNLDEERTQLALQTILNNPNLKTVLVHDENGKLFTRRDDQTSDDHDKYSRSADIMFELDSGEISKIGQLTIIGSEEFILHTFYDRLITIGSVLIILVLAISLAIFFVANYVIYRPLGIIRSALGHATKRSLKAPISESGVKEFDEVIAAFNRMWAAQQAHENDLLLLQNQLEVRVKDRTTELQTAALEAQSANIAKSRFLSSMSHEIRTPLNGVLGLAQLLAASSLNEDQQKKVNTILSSGQTLLAILNDVLDMSRIEAGGIELEEETFSLKNVISTISTPFQSLADDKGLKLIVNDNLSSNQMVIGDPVRLRQVLWNLLSNAIKFTAFGRVTLTINEESPAHNSKLEKNKHLFKFSIEDTGPGIAPDRVEKIFDAFTQEDSSITRKFGGTGLGLSIVKQLTALMGGTIETTSELSRGTRIDVYIPYTAASKEETDCLSGQNNQIDIAKTEPLNVLIAEDNEVNALIARSFLEASGHKVKHVENGKLAVEAAKEDWADFILMDIHMPEMDGIDATKMIRESGPRKNLPIVGLTAEAFLERHNLFIEAGMDGVLTKPYTQQQLVEVLVKYRLAREHVDQNDEPLSLNHAIGRGLSQDLDSIAPYGVNPGTAFDNPAAVGNEAGLASFRLQINSDVTLANLLETAETTLLDLTETINLGVTTANPQLVREAAHTLRGAAGSLFAVRISELAGTIEEQSDDIESVAKLIPEFKEVAGKTIEWWRDQSTYLS